ncbi:hypothetical protein WN943_015504 [Citrus x changshan-huyou]
MSLKHSENLIRTPDFTGVPNLENLILEECTRLRKIFMKSLKTLVLPGCLKLKKFPDIVGSSFGWNCIYNLLAFGNSVKDNFKQGAAVEASFGRNCKLPASIERLSGLVLLNLKDWKNLESLPSTINGLRSLRTLHLFDCSTLENVPESLGKVESLEVRLSC